MSEPSERGKRMLQRAKEAARGEVDRHLREGRAVCGRSQGDKTPRQRLMASDFDRYDLEHVGSGHLSVREMVPSDDGDWVDAERALARIAELEREVVELRDEVTTVRHDMAHAAEAAERDGHDDTAEAYRIVVTRLDCAIAKGVRR